jgi:cytochrome P450
LYDDGKYQREKGTNAENNDEASLRLGGDAGSTERVAAGEKGAADVRELFGGVNINMYDGPRHKALKEILLQGFDEAALESYIPSLQRLTATAFSR